MNTPRLHALVLAALTAGTLSATASAADAPAASAGDCVQLGSDQQLVRANASRDVLLRNGENHYRVHFQDDCSKAAYSRKLSFNTEGQTDQLCGAGRTQLRTDAGQCTVARVEAIDADTFKQKVRQRSR